MPLRLRGRVTGLESASKFTDKKPRVEITVDKGGTCFNTLTVPNDGDLQMDQELIITVIEMGAPELEAERAQQTEKHG